MVTTWSLENRVIRDNQNSFSPTDRKMMKGVPISAEKAPAPLPSVDRVLLGKWGFSLGAPLPGLSHCVPLALASCALLHVLQGSKDQASSSSEMEGTGVKAGQGPGIGVCAESYQSDRGPGWSGVHQGRCIGARGLILCLLLEAWLVPSPRKAAAQRPQVPLCKQLCCT